MKLPRKCSNHEALSLQDSKRRRDEEQIRTTQTSHIKPQMHKQRRTATVESSLTGQQENYSGLKPLLLSRNLTYISWCSSKQYIVQTNRKQETKWTAIDKDGHNASITIWKQ